VSTEQKDIQERVVSISRVAKVVKGGRRFSFSALVVVGDGSGKVGYSLGKANEVPEAIGKATRGARKILRQMNIVDGTIPHEVVGKFGAATVILMPAKAGTGVIAGGAVRAVLETAGVKNILTKCVGTTNPHNVLRATINGLSQLQTSSEIYAGRGKEA